MGNDADWTSTAAGDSEPNDKRGQKEYNKYADAARTHGASSPQARQALQKALNAGFTFDGLGPSGGEKRRGASRRSSGRPGGRRGGGNGGGIPHTGTPVDE